MSKKLTVTAVKKMRAGPARREIPDGEITGLYLCIQASGAKSFVMRYRHGGRPRKLTIGPADMGLGKVRKIAAEARAEIARGADPAGAKQAAKSAARADCHSVAAVADRFIKKHVVKMRPATQREAERLLRVEIIPKLGKRLFSDVKRADVRKLVEDIAERAPIVANRTLSLFRLFCNWAREQDIIEVSPCDGLKPPAPERTRERILSDDEIRLFWQACDTIGWPFGPLAQLLLLTGARRDEVGAMTWKEVDLESATWRLSGERVKNAREHVVPLSPQAMRVLKGLPRIGDGKGFVFSMDGETPVSGFSRAKTRLDAEMAMAMQETSPAAEDIPPWVFHDLRRTAASGMASLKIAPHVIEAALNHASGTIKGVAAVYNRYRYDDEKRHALETWGRRVKVMTSKPAATNVVELRAGA